MFRRVLLTHALALSASKSIRAQDDKLYKYALRGIRTDEADLYRARGCNLIRHRGSE